MVQQIASLKTESAASTLPFSLSASAISMQSATRQTFDNELLRQSGGGNVFEQPRQPFQTDAVRNSSADPQHAISRTRKSDREASTQRQAAALEKQNIANELMRARADEQRSRRQDDTEEAKQNDAGASSAQDRKSQSNETTSASNYERSTSSNASADSESKVVDIGKFSGSEKYNIFDSENAVEAAHEDPKAITSQETSQSEGKSVNENFDYIDYVTQLAEFTGSGVDEKINTKQEPGFITTVADPKNTFVMPQELIDKTKIDSIGELQGETQNAQEKVNTLNIPVLSSPLSGDGSDLSINMSKQDLEAITKIRQAQLGSESNLSSEEKVELSRIVDELIGQLDVLNADPAGTTNADFSEADKTLLIGLLMNSSANANADTDTENTTLDKAVLSEATLVNQLSVKEMKDLHDAPTLNQNGGVGKMPAQADKVVSTELKSDLLENDKANMSAKGLQPDMLAGSGEAKPAKEDKKSDATGFSLRNITQLNEEQSKVALESLSARLQTVASEIGVENKGNEFIASLQSGVKEFKQQLAQGREPGIDLKAIVAEALAQISGESATTQQPKIDASLNQFNAVLNLANAVNSSASQQQAQVLGITDNQLAKEFTVQHIEGTKLANGIQNQLNTQATTDKAINIFKQEGQQQLAEKVRWMVNSKSATAEIRLDPPDLGGINIKINLSGDVAQVNFNVQSAAAKEALDQAAPRLREMLQDQGIELGESVVQQDSHSGQQGEASNGGDNLAQAKRTLQGSEQGSLEENAINVVEQRVSNGVLGGIDYYA